MLEGDYIHLITPWYSECKGFIKCIGRQAYELLYEKDKSGVLKSI